MTIERRFTSGSTAIQTRADGAKFITGRAVVFGDMSGNLGGFREIIHRDAFKETNMGDVRGLFNHDPNRVLGRNASGTMRLSVSDGGVDYEIDVPDTSFARDLVVSMERGDVNQSSFAFTVAPGGADWTEDEDNEGPVRYIRTVMNVAHLYDVSPVTYPAYDSTTSGTRAAGDVSNALDELKYFLEGRDSQQAARIKLQLRQHQAEMISRGIKIW